jgi:hypothetical protein
MNYYVRIFSYWVEYLITNDRPNYLLHCIGAKYRRILNGLEVDYLPEYIGEYLLLPHLNDEEKEEYGYFKAYMSGDLNYLPI